MLRRSKYSFELFSGKTLYFFILLIFVVGVIVAPDIFYRLTYGGEESRLGGVPDELNELGMLP